MPTCVWEVCWRSARPICLTRRQSDFSKSPSIQGDYALAGDVSPVASPEDRLEYGSEIGSFSALTRRFSMPAIIWENLRHFLAFRHPVSTDNQAPVLPVSAAPAAMFLFMTGLVTVAGVARLQYTDRYRRRVPPLERRRWQSLSRLSTPPLA